MITPEHSAEHDARRTCEPKCRAWGIGCACRAAERDALLTDAEIVEHVRKFIARRGEFITACRNSGGDDSDYYRWLGHAGARRELAEALGWDVPGGWL